ncbi:tail fiber domain-containing protein [bacterium]|nr:tail fiber domain-containing protein [bacterium]
MFFLYLSAFALAISMGDALDCGQDETLKTDTAGNEHCTKSLATVLRSTNTECSLDAQTLWINVATASQEVFFLNSEHWRATDATVEDKLKTNTLEVEASLTTDTLDVTDKVTTDTLEASTMTINTNVIDGLIKSANIDNDAVGPAELDSSTHTEYSIVNLHVRDDFRVADTGFVVDDTGSETVSVTIKGQISLEKGTGLGMIYTKRLTVDEDTYMAGHLVVNGDYNGGPNGQGCFWAKGYPLSTDKGDFDWEWECGSWASEVGIHAKSSIYSERYLLASDRRIKEMIEPVPDNLALNTLRKLDAKYYFYKAKLERGFRRTIGFIAQDVLQHIPEAVNNITEYIPDKLEVLENVRWSETEDGWQMVVDGLEPGTYKFFMSNENDDAEDIHELETKDGKTFLVSKKYTTVFLYGGQIDDFLSLSKDKIWAVAYAALQQVDKNQQVLQQKVSDLESTVVALSERLTQLEQQT